MFDIIVPEEENDAVEYFIGLRDDGKYFAYSTSSPLFYIEGKTEDEVNNTAIEIINTSIDFSSCMA